MLAQRFAAVRVLDHQRAVHRLPALRRADSGEAGTPVRPHAEAQLPQLQKAIKLKQLDGADLAAVYNALGYAHFAQEQYDLAIRQYKDALKHVPDYVTALNNLGHAYERKSMTNKAIEAYDQALALEPNNDTSKRRAESLKKRVPV